MKVIVNKDRCKECGLCIHHCPKQAISKCNTLNAGGYRRGGSMKCQI